MRTLAAFAQEKEPLAVVHYLTATAAVAAVVTIAAQARADQITFFLNQGECSGAGCGPSHIISDASAVRVVVNLSDSHDATVTFTPPVGTSNITTPVYVNVNDGGVVTNVTATSNVPGNMFRSDPGQAEDSSEI
jgi:hypothetical protein